MVDLQTALSTTLHDSMGSGSGGIDWTFSIPDKDLDFLSVGETLTATYKSSDLQGATPVVSVSGWNVPKFDVVAS